MIARSLLFFVGILLVGGLTGCSTSPVPVTGRSTLANGAVLVGATAGGALIGNQVNSKWGAPVGAVVGLGAGALTNMALNKSTDRVRAEAYAQGKRDAAVAKLDQAWAEQTSTPAHTVNDANAGGEDVAPKSYRQVSYESGTYEGVNRLRRSGSVPVVEPPK